VDKPVARLESRHRRRERVGESLLGLEREAVHGHSRRTIAATALSATDSSSIDVIGT
jgi:hypothetical protein